MKKTVLIFLTLSSFIATAQDSIPKKNPITHELGFNSILLIKQIVSNNPNTTLPQLPYQIIYTLNFRDKFGIRAGLGINQSKTETTILGDPIPRTTTALSSAYRLGISRDFLNFKNLSANVFVDGTIEQTELNTKTQTSSGGGFISNEDITSKTMAYGPEIGFGLKYSFNKHIALYTEVPLQFVLNSSSETDTQSSTDNFSGNTQTTTTFTSSKGHSIKIFLPTTLFLTVIF